MVNARLERPQTHRQGVFAVLAIAVDIAQVVDVEHRRRQQAAGGRRQDQDAVDQVCVCKYQLPTTLSQPKNTSTEISPSPK